MNGPPPTLAGLPGASSETPPTQPAPWWSGPLFHFLTGATALAFAVGWLHSGGDPTVAAGAAIGGLTFLGVGAGVAAASQGQP